ncbi:Hypothetical predicted protein, partial [Marmota monax]
SILFTGYHRSLLALKSSKCSQEVSKLQERTDEQSLAQIMSQQIMSIFAGFSKVSCLYSPMN